MLRFDLTGKVAFVTGGAEGLGKEFIEAFANQGAEVAACDIQDEKMRETVRELAQKTNKKIRGWHCDVRLPGEVKQTVAEVVGEFGKIDILINNAGILTYGSLEDYTFEEWNDVIQTDLTGVWLVTKEVMLQSMIPNKNGRVINLSSIGGLMAGTTGCISYNAAKGGVINLTRAQAVQYARYGVLVNSIGPGAMLNGTMSSRSPEAMDPETHKKSRTPLKRAGNHEMHSIAIYLASDENSYITGQNINVDGGYTAAL